MGSIQQCLQAIAIHDQTYMLGGSGTQTGDVFVDQKQRSLSQCPKKIQIVYITPVDVTIQNDALSSNGASQMNL